jgi:hypothetical protein
MEERKIMVRQEREIMEREEKKIIGVMRINSWGGRKRYHGEGGEGNQWEGG